MKIRDYTVPELNHFRQYCNFTPEESELFELLSGDATLEECSEKMCCGMTKVNTLCRRVRDKIGRV